MSYLPYLTLSYLALPCLSCLTLPKLPYLTLLYLTLLTLPCLTIPCLTIPYLPYLILSYFALPYLDLPYLVVPYLTLPHLTSPPLKVSSRRRRRPRQCVKMSQGPKPCGEMTRRLFPTVPSNSATPCDRHCQRVSVAVSPIFSSTMNYWPFSSCCFTHNIRHGDCLTDIQSTKLVP